MTKIPAFFKGKLFLCIMVAIFWIQIHAPELHAGDNPPVFGQADNRNNPAGVTDADLMREISSMIQGKPKITTIAADENCQKPATEKCVAPLSELHTRRVVVTASGEKR